MRNLFHAFLFRLTKDLTFKITLIIGMSLALAMTGLYAAIGALDGHAEMFCNGQSMLVTSLNPGQNFGLAIPVNLISFTVLEFTQGIIRNKIIAGNSKTKIYINLFLSGLVFSLVLITVYCAITFGLGSAIGGFDPNGEYTSSILSLILGTEGSVEYLVKTLVSAVFVYITITSMTIFFATLFRSIGPCIPIVIILILIASISAQYIPLINEDAEMAFRFINPLHALTGLSEGSKLVIPTDKFIEGIGCNLMWTLIFFVPGLLIFRKRDIK